MHDRPGALSRPLPPRGWRACTQHREQGSLAGRGPPDTLRLEIDYDYPCA